MRRYMPKTQKIEIPEVLDPTPLDVAMTTARVKMIAVPCHEKRTDCAKKPISKESPILRFPRALEGNQRGGRLECWCKRDSKVLFFSSESNTQIIVPIDRTGTSQPLRGKLWKSNLGILTKSNKGSSHNHKDHCARVQCKIVPTRVTLGRVHLAYPRRARTWCKQLLSRVAYTH
jgi:hypothetical protein